MKPDQQINEVLAIFVSAMTAVAARLIRAGDKPSKTVILGEIIMGLTFCFIIAPAVQEHYGLSVKAICAMTWTGAFFSSLLLGGAEKIIRGYIEKLTPKPDDDQ